MKPYTLAAILVCSQVVEAYPAFVDSPPTPSWKRAKSYTAKYPNVDGLTLIPDAAHPFIQPNVTGGPGIADQRGVCPGINTLANHGYIPRNGIVNLAQLIVGAREAFNIAEDLATVLGSIAITLTGNPITMTVSIGGPDPRVNMDDPNSTWAGLTASALFGPARGLNAHNSFETDSSMSKYDYYLNKGDDFDWAGPIYKGLSDIAEAAGDDYSLESVQEQHYRRHMDSRANNPGWYNVPASSILSTGAASFVSRSFANGTYESGGVANHDNVDVFFGAIPNADRTVFGWVQERFPVNWFRSATNYDLKLTVQDILQTYQRYPELTVYGGNAGTTKSFVPLGLNPPTDLNGLGCFLYETQMANLPNQFSGATDDGAQLALTSLNCILEPIFMLSFGCSNYLSKDATYSSKFHNFTVAMRDGFKQHGMAVTF